MALMRCSHCNRKISTRARECPKCGATYSSGFWRWLLERCGITVTLLSLVKGIQDQYAWMKKNEDFLAGGNLIRLADIVLRYFGKGIIWVFLASVVGLLLASLLVRGVGLVGGMLGLLGQEDYGPILRRQKRNSYDVPQDI